MTACKDTDDLIGSGEGQTAADQAIHIGGVTADELVASAVITREGDTESDETVLRTDAENISWLVKPLSEGLDITYGKSTSVESDKNERVAVLDLQLDANNNIIYSEDKVGDVTNKYAEYTFKYRDNSSGELTNVDAKWYDNGAHYFQGVYVPDAIEFDASTETIDNVQANLTTDQHDDTSSGETLGNYTLLSHYLGMPSNFKLSATVARVKLPFRHRLARVLAYILIDPAMGDTVKIKGYKSSEAETTAGKEDPTTSSIRFCNVKVLQGVKDEVSLLHHTYTPQWTEVRKVIPHFVDERGSYNDSTNTVMYADKFYAYYHVADKRYIYPDDKEWQTIYNKGENYFSGDGTVQTSTDNVYERTDYGKVPVYDLIVRPTYTSSDNVMYDEEGVNDATTKNELLAATNQIDFEITLSNGLQYNKRFIFDLNANYQTVVYLHISKERVDYNSSGSELWIETKADDDYYGVNNQNNNNLSFAGSGWQRAYTNIGTDYVNSNTGTEVSDGSLKITDGHYYKQDDEDRYAQYVDDNTWIEMLREAHKDGKHHGDYFILSRDISIPAAAFGDSFVFTGHLDGQDHTITLTNASYTAAYDAYEDYDDASLTKYVKIAEDSYQEFTPAATTYYQKVSEDNYSEIADINAYAGTYAYTRAVGSYTYTIVLVGSDYSGGPYYNSSHEEIINIDDYMAMFNNTIYTRSQNPYSYSEVSSPTGDPKSQGWYEKNGDVYTLTEDTSVNSEKTYYTKDPVSYTYTAVADAKTLSPDGTYYDSEHNHIENINTHIGVYTRETNYNYTEIHFYKFVHHASVIGSSTGTPTDGYIFSGLNGNYTTAQENATDPTSVVWEANVHKENGVWVPYKGDNDGWRAEVINLNVNGGALFKSGITYGTNITGYVHNCWLNGTFIGGKWSGTKVQEYTPAIPKY